MFCLALLVWGNIEDMNQTPETVSLRCTWPVEHMPTHRWLHFRPSMVDECMGFAENLACHFVIEPPPEWHAIWSWHARLPQIRKFQMACFIILCKRLCFMNFPQFLVYCKKCGMRGPNQLQKLAHTYGSPTVHGTRVLSSLSAGRLPPGLTRWPIDP